MKSKLIVLLLIGIFGLISVYFIYGYWSSKNERVNKSITEGNKAIKTVTNDLDSILNNVTNRGQRIKDLVSTHSLSQEEIVELVKKESRDSYYIQGITIAYGHQLSEEDSLFDFAPFYDKRRGRVIFLENRYDYTIDSIESNHWFTVPFNSKKTIWSEPYLATAANLVVADYGIPFYDAENTQVAGVISLTLDLKKIADRIDSLVLGHTGMGMLVSKEGSFIAHPYPEFILEQTLNEVAEDIGIQSDLDKIYSSKSGQLSYSRTSGQSGYTFFATIPHCEWKALIVFNTSDLLGNTVATERKIVYVGLSLSTLLFLFFVYYLLGAELTITRKLWLGSIASSLLIVVNIVLMWNINLSNTTFRLDENEINIETRTELEGFVRKENQKARTLGMDQLIPVQTGIFIEEFEFLDSYTVAIRGQVWQKWPVHLGKFFDAGFRFPQEALTGLKKLEKISIEEEKKYTKHVWAFRLNLKMGLDYSRYPFDVRDINIEIMYPDPESGILLVPDLESYSDTAPHSKPGINSDIYFRDSKLVASNFSFEIVNFQEHFGHQRFKGLNSYPIMNFNINLKRRLLNVMVTNIIPILVVASMIFLIFYSTTRDKEDKSGVSMMGVVQSCAGFFFVLLVAHIDLRRRLSTPELTYIETFYLTMYVIMAILAINVVTFTKTDRYPWLLYKDNLIVKISYWPVLLFSWMFITQIIFYF
ncbi:PDC sensor domain-containing protein [Reichenbachiella ulvae]|uniref:Cache domain-containing protein n=1 Tax=Reichenbachiella ulvae TaxID=2980104 RepID=A0ABT3CY57_9BACT|nr:cache domain-containing protein [Reichenbachiella ulvae]MCV9388630.1 cache domain-containing protein [Reichenbachiella ulvae]